MNTPRERLLTCLGDAPPATVTEVILADLARLTAERDALRAQLDAIEQDGTAEHNAAVELRSQLAAARVENEKLREALRMKMYGAPSGYRKGYEDEVALAALSAEEEKT